MKLRQVDVQRHVVSAAEDEARAHGDGINAALFEQRRGGVMYLHGLHDRAVKLQFFVLSPSAQDGAGVGLLEPEPQVGLEQMLLAL